MNVEVKNLSSFNIILLLAGEIQML